MIQPRLGFLHGSSLNAEGNILGLGQTVIALGQLHLQHVAVLGTDGIEVIVPGRDPDALLEAFRIGRHVHEGQFEVDGTVKEVQETAPFLKDGSLILLLCQLVVDILKLNGFGVIVVRHTADAIRKHTLKRDGLLGGAGNAVISSGRLHDFTDLVIFFLGQVLRKIYGCCLCLTAPFSQLCKQLHLPPFPPVPDASGWHNSYPSDRDGPSALQIWPE